MTTTPPSSSHPPAVPPAAVRIGTRGSALARAQSEHVAARLRAVFPRLDVQIVEIHTRGDHDLTTPLHHFGNAGVFVRELEEALLDGRVDLAVHSLKDLPVQSPPGLTVRPAMARELPLDALVTRNGADFAALPPGAKVGTGSLRRTAALRALRGDLDVQPIRGNVNTRLAKLDAGDYDALVMAAAGLHRLGFADRIAQTFSPDDMVPAPAQGILGVEWRSDDASMAVLAAALCVAAVEAQATAERAFLAATGAGCHAPVGAIALPDTCTPEHWQPTPDDYAGPLLLCGFVASPDGEEVVSGQLPGTQADAAKLGSELAAALMAAGAAAILAAAPQRESNGNANGNGNGGAPQ